MRVRFADNSVEQYEDTPMAGGAQGTIYRSHDLSSVVKIDKSTSTNHTQQRQAQLEMLIQEFNPTRLNSYWNDFFSWPEKIVTHVQKATSWEACTGYRMPYVQRLKKASFYIVKVAHRMLKPEERGWFLGYIACALKIATAAEQLAHMGLCYADFSEDNLLLDTFSGRAVLLDCDALTIPGKLPASVQGTHRYRAPEIVTGQAGPSVETDRHALAILFYSLLVRAHPLFTQKYCRCTDQNHTLCLGQQPLYIEHPTNYANHPQQRMLTSQHLGNEMYQLFQRAFVHGLHDPLQRPLAREWVEALTHVYDRTIPCNSPGCQLRFFVAQPDAPLVCPDCSNALEDPHELPFIYLFPAQQPSYLNVWAKLPSAHYLVAWPGRILHSWHVQAQTKTVWNTPDYIPNSTPCASFQWDQQTQRWYLKNLGLPDATSYPSMQQPHNGSSYQINTLLPLTDGMMIQFSHSPEAYCAYVKMRKVG